MSEIVSVKLGFAGLGIRVAHSERIVLTKKLTTLSEFKQLNRERVQVSFEQR